jgi:hypothetical protein
MVAVKKGILAIQPAVCRAGDKSWAVFKKKRDVICSIVRQPVFAGGQ